MYYLALCDSFEYLCYGSTAIINIFTLPVRGSTLRRQILMSKVNARAVGINDITCVAQKGVE